MKSANMEERVAAIRKFNRFFTREIGVLREGFLHSPYSLTEVRILWELAHSDNLTASRLAKELGLDQGYLSRTLARFEENGLLTRVRSESDARQLLLNLTAAGKEKFSVLDQRSHDEAADMLSEMSEEKQQRLLKAMETIESILDKNFKFSEPFLLRQHRPGDMGSVVHMHGRLYSQEYNWDDTFEALVAQIVSDFINNLDPVRERAWIAEMDGEVVGSVFCVKAAEDTAKLRLLLVDPRARGYGLGTRLVIECIRFARKAGYKKMVLWTNSCLLEARHIYDKLGFKLMESEAHRSFGYDLVGENWELSL
jgi:DNA-binding MarR family transcriptional regulator/N-acetylglutamate synthase-like GNAT family acetyltransferase